MASKRPPLKLQFTVQGGKKVPPLTSENVACVFKTGVLTRKDFKLYDVIKGKYLSFGDYLGVPDSLLSEPLSAATWWVRHGSDRRWKCIIYYLDRVGERGLADELMPYYEPPSDSSLTAERVTPVFMKMWDWTGIRYSTTIVPDGRISVICRQYQSDEEQRRQGAIYYVNVVPMASWRHLAGLLCQLDESKAIRVFKAQLPKSKDITLTVRNMMSATDGVHMPLKANGSFYLNMPDATYNRIVKKCGGGSTGRKELFYEFLSSHPYPTWGVVLDLVEALEGKGYTRAGHAQELKKKYMSSVQSLFDLCVGHILNANNYKLYGPLLPQLLPHHVQTHISHVLCQISPD